MTDLPTEGHGSQLPPEIEDALADALFRGGSKSIDALISAHPEHGAAIRQRIAELKEPEGPESIGPYEILEQIGEGGMGIVFLAEQQAPIRRRVALKVLKLGMDSRSVLMRFEAERQALALMNHDHIAKVFDAGTTASGQPYFAMEHVPGLPIVEFCDRSELGTRARLGLFLDVCDGVQHAHQKGVIHRDLKPSNVLVTEQSGRAVPKIIDFGIAKALDQQLCEATLLTEEGVLVGTPAYASPEQADAGASAVDTRSDVYSLGVILYELLSGSLPFDSKGSGRAAVLELLRAIREDDPPRPSTRMTTLEHVKALRSDLDWVVMKALEKNPEHRYASPHEFAEDLRRFLANEPVSAGPPSAAYRMRKFARRYRGQLIAVAAVFVVLLGGAITSTVFAVQASRRAATIAEQNVDLKEAAESIRLRTEDFEMLANATSLEAARAKERTLYPAWPSRLTAMELWLEEDWSRLQSARGRLQATLERLRGRARKQELSKDDAAQRERRRLESLQLAHDRADRIRAAGGKVKEPQLSADVAARPVRELAEDALRLVHHRRVVFGREAEGLALARAAWAKSERQILLAGYAFANALLANGHDSELLQMADDYVAKAVAKRIGHYVYDVKMYAKAAQSAENRREARRVVAEQLAQVHGGIVRSTRWLFDDPADQYLHDSLSDVAQRIDRFAEREVAAVRARVAWAKKVQGLSIDKHAKRWAAARKAIKEADGESASRLYARVPIDLVPQLGLVPIGMNPATKLWEFYHLRSAERPDRIPRHRRNGRIRLPAHAGMVFVLLPGGRFDMGAQAVDSSGANFDRNAVGNEFPVRPHEVAPFFMSRFEMTKAQWKRLAGTDPSSFRVDTSFMGDPEPVTGSHPIESVTWRDCNRELGQEGLAIPTETQWEYACRAGTSWPWFTGREAKSLDGFANIMDERAVAFVPQWGKPAPFNDGHTGIAVVGSFRPNGFGLHDMIGNVQEWCRDVYAFYHWGREEDGVRQALDWVSIEGVRISRGGCYRDIVTSCRASDRTRVRPDLKLDTLGIRPSREIRR